MAQLTKNDIDTLMKQMNVRYQPYSGECVATPAAMDLLLQRLRAYTTEVQKAAEREGLDEDENVQQWALDMAAWQQRLGHYQAELNSVPESEWYTKKGCEAIYTEVTAPLMDGIWYTILPGISLMPEEKSRMQSGVGHPQLDVGRCTDASCKEVVIPDHPPGHSNVKPPDVHVPFTLGNQVLVYQQHQRERWEQFWKDLWDETKKMGEKLQKAGTAALDIGTGLAPWILGTVAVVGAGYLYFKYKASKKRPKEYEEKAA
jgi:hypothetical protein